MTRSFELLAHFSCVHCSQWWSIASSVVDRAQNYFNHKDFYCPWCGEVNEHEAGTVGGEVPAKEDTRLYSSSGYQEKLF